MEASAEYSRGQEILKPAFEKVQDATNWKNPIDVYVSGDTDIEVLREAIIFFTGSVPSFEKAAYKQGNAIVRGYRVRAAGYYASIGA